jgi:hypothetical protein
MAAGWVSEHWEFSPGCNFSSLYLSQIFVNVKTESFLSNKIGCVGEFTEQNREAGICFMEVASTFTNDENGLC